MCQPNDGKDMIGRPASDESPENERDRLQRLLRPVLRLDLLLLLPPEPDHDGNDDGDDDNDGDADEPDSLYLTLYCSGMHENELILSHLTLAKT